MRLEGHPLVRQADSHLTFDVLETTDPLYDKLAVDGVLFCTNGLQLDIHKLGQFNRSSHQVRMYVYDYNAWFPGAHNVLRYDNQHPRQQDVYHRHEFDPTTGEEVAHIYLSRVEFPVMHQVLDELQRLYPPAEL